MIDRLKSVEENFENIITNLKEMMSDNGMKEWIEYGDLLLQYCGRNKRVFDVLSNKDFISKSKKMFLNAFGNKDNVFMQHVSFLNDLMEKLIKGRLRDNEIDTLCKGYENLSKVKKVIVFGFGGITFEEAKDLTLLGKQNNLPFVIGGTNIINSKSF